MPQDGVIICMCERPMCEVCMHLLSGASGSLGWWDGVEYVGVVSVWCLCNLSWCGSMVMHVVAWVCCVGDGCVEKLCSSHVHVCLNWQNFGFCV